MIQLQFLNRALDSKEVTLFTLNNINEEFFSDFPAEYKFIQEHISKYGTVPDKATFLTTFPDFDLIEVTESEKYLVDELYSDRNKRFLAKTFNKVRELLNAGKTEEAMTLYTSAADQAVKAVHLDSVDIFHDVSRYDKYVEKCQDFSKYYVKTGFDELDAVIGGWDKNEELATLVARPGVGKTWCLLRVALAAAKQGLTVGIYSGEMSEIKVGYRIDTLASNISNSGITRGRTEVQNTYKKYIDELPTKYRGTIKVLTPQMIQGPAGISALRGFIEKDKLDILCIDQHSLLEDDRHGHSPVEKAANISRDLKNLQVLKKIPIIAVSQQNRESTDAGLNTALVAQTDRISQDSTIVIFFEQKDNVLTLNLVKSRDSVSNSKIQYAIELDKGIFTYIPSNTDATNGAACSNLRKEFDESPAEENPF